MKGLQTMHKLITCPMRMHLPSRGRSNIIRHHNLPDEIVADNGGEFDNTLLKDIYEERNIALTFGSVHNPIGKAALEKMHSTLQENVTTYYYKT